MLVAREQRLFGMAVKVMHLTGWNATFPPVVQRVARVSELVRLRDGMEVWSEFLSCRKVHV